MSIGNSAASCSRTATTLHTTSSLLRNKPQTVEMAEERSQNNATPPQPRRRRIIAALTGATGSILGIKILIAFRRLNIETHLIISKWAESTLKYETSYTATNVRALADHVYNNHDMAPLIATGPYRVDGMIVVTCSMKTLAAINSDLCDTLIARAAEVMIKERRKPVLAAENVC